LQVTYVRAGTWATSDYYVFIAMIDFLPYMNLIGLVLLFIGYIFAQLNFGGKDVAREVIVAYKERQDQLELLLKDAQARIAELALDLASLKEQLLEKDKKLEEFTRIFQGKSPELIDVLFEMRDALKQLPKKLEKEKLMGG